MFAILRQVGGSLEEVPRRAGSPSAARADGEEFLNCVRSSYAAETL